MAERRLARGRRIRLNSGQADSASVNVVGVPGHHRLVGVDRRVAERVVVQVGDDPRAGLIGKGPDEVGVELRLRDHRRHAVLADGVDELAHFAGARVLTGRIDERRPSISRPYARAK